MSIQPVNKAVEHLITSTRVLRRGGGGGVNVYLIKNIKGREWGRRGMGGEAGNGGGGGGHPPKQSEGLGRVLWVYKMGLK